MAPEVLKLILYLLISPLFLFLFHLIIVRINSFIGLKILPQNLLLLCILILNIPFFYFLLFFLGNQRSIFAYIYGLFIFNAFAFFYFQFFGMSETARRIKLLISIRTSKIKTIKDTLKYYDYQKTLNIRLWRLEQFGQIKKIDKNLYSMNNKTLYYITNLIILFKYILGFEVKKK